MKAVVFEKFGGPDVLKLKDMTKPQAGPNQVVVKVHVVGVNPVETYIRQGKWGPVPFPFISGSDAAGEIDETGEGVVKFKKGDRVWIFFPQHNGAGCYAEYMVCPVTNVFRLPDNSSYKEGAALGGPYCTAAHALYTNAKPRPSETLLVHGASGGVGIAAVQFGKAHGMTVIGTAGSEEGMALVKKCGADHVFCHKNKDYQKKIMEVTGGKGPNVILEMLADVNLQKDLEMIADKGHINVIGARGDIKISPGLLMTKSCAMTGTRVLKITQDELNDYAARITTGLKQGWLKPVIGKEYPLAKASEAHEKILKGPAKGKIILNVV